MPYELVLFKNIHDPRAKEIDRYIELGGYKAAEKVVKQMTEKDVIVYSNFGELSDGQEIESIPVDWHPQD